MQRHARTLLFVPGDRPDRFARAAASGADGVLIDLEDAVAPQDKARAREAAAAWLTGHRALVRVNATGTVWHDDDLAALAEAPGLAGVVLPKSSTAPHVASVVARLPPGAVLLALVESAVGLRDADAIAGVPGVGRLLFGSVDYALDVGVLPSEPGQPELDWARCSLVNASRAAGLPAPLDGVYTRLDDERGLRESSLRARALGFGGRLCVHPAQIPTVHRAWRPTGEEVRWARRILEVAGDSLGAAVRVDGQMIDLPRLEWARGVLAPHQDADARSRGPSGPGDDRPGGVGGSQRAADG
ncbi:HpcH/HpaI aldolase/citrate lyase family protein [Streptomyces radicis]|uniref:CoA ester lyase n=1 Tax=Streptomyces radicis TaxID=1750517 RepID=A0A3A9WHI9_9ACTN|nr:CoA ester lyase [Streptomyces radicis]RKN12425.1 CoA ester lyase [Streptomyces radicis]RKN27805.1 CoA ester lyase [Streptomyces radicis]